MGATYAYTAQPATWIPRERVSHNPSGAAASFGILHSDTKVTFNLVSQDPLVD